MALPPTADAPRERWILLDTRVGRRVFVLFVLGALIPVGGMALVSYRNVGRHVRDLSEQRVRETAKAAGLALIERLLAADGQLLDVMDAASVRGRAAEARFLESVDVMAPTGAVGLDEDAWARLDRGEPLLALDTRRGGEVGMTLLRISEDGERLFRGAVSVDSALAAARVYSESTFGAGICLLASGGRRIGCDAPLATAFAEGWKPESGAQRGSWEWTAGGQDYLGGYWSAPMEASFGAPPMLVAVAETGEGLRVPVQAFTSAFLLAMGLCMALVLAFSTLVIRRSLAPLEQLKRAALGLAESRFDTRVEIDSGDEFEELGNAFNSMAGRIGSQLEELRNLHVGTIRALARAIDASSPWTRGHSERVAQLSVALAGRLGHGDDALELIYRGGLLHDVGKIGVPPEILDKPGALSESEFAKVEAHPLIGVTILEPVSQLEALLPMVRSHHERIDGTGYPDGLSQDQIHPYARILAVADVWDAITSDRPYRPAMSFDEALGVILLGSGTHFDPVVAEAFEAIARDWYRRPPMPQGFEPQRFSRATAGV